MPNGIYLSFFPFDFRMNICFLSKSKQFKRNATTSLTLIVLNHLLSAADGAWSVSMFNKDLKVKTGVHLEKEYSELGQKKLVPVANLNVSF